MIAGTSRKEKCPQDNGTKEFEHLIAVTFPGFEKVATRLQFTGAERFQNFEDVLAGNVVAQWRQVMRTWPANQRTLARFPRALQALLVGLQGPDVGDKLVSYMTAEGSCMKRKIWNPMDFKSRYTEMMMYATTYFNCWKVTLPNENQWKEHYLNRYYRPWVDQYNVLESSVHDRQRADVNILTITTFMQNL